MSNNRPTLLLADDDPTIADSLAPFLERAGFHVLVVSDGVNALEKVQAHHPELIILDVLMPRMDGRTAFRAMRDHAPGNGLPIVLMSAMAEPADLDPEIAAFLRKPVDLEDLLALVARLLMDG